MRYCASGMSGRVRLTIQVRSGFVAPSVSAKAHEVPLKPKLARSNRVMTVCSGQQHEECDATHVPPAQHRQPCRSPTAIDPLRSPTDASDWRRQSPAEQPMASPRSRFVPQGPASPTPRSEGGVPPGQNQVRTMCQWLPHPQSAATDRSLGMPSFGHWAPPRVPPEGNRSASLCCREGTCSATRPHPPCQRSSGPTSRAVFRLVSQLRMNGLTDLTDPNFARWEHCRGPPGAAGDSSRESSRESSLMSHLVGQWIDLPTKSSICLRNATYVWGEAPTKSLGPQAAKLPREAGGTRPRRFPQSPPCSKIPP